MRKRYIILTAALLPILGACSKSELDLYPYNTAAQEVAYETEEDMELAVNGMYYGIRASGSYYNGTWNIVADAMSDNLIINQAGRRSLNDYQRWNLKPGATEYGLFAGGYTMARRANAILENIDKFPAGPFHDNTKGQALAIRGMVYFDMSRVYGKTYTNATDNDLTIPYVTTTDPTILPAKEPVKGFYDKVLADLNQALTLIDANNGTGKLNKAAVAGLLSRVNLYKGDYAAVITAANAALGATPDLPGIADFPRIWTDQTEKGVLFKVINNLTDNINTQGVNYYQPVSGELKSEYVVEYNFMQLFTDADIRKSTYIRTSPFSGNDYNNVIKYNGGAGKAQGVCDAKVLRTAEVLLNRAEAYYRSGNEPAALADLNLLKANRYTGFTDINLSGQALLDEILKERRLELAFEGDRFWDLKRRHQSIQRDGTKGDRADGSGIPYVATALTLDADDYRFQLPIPIVETNYNKNLVQNPGY
ncbi:RagB/SusD family nutrient uptake outer membrane protein [uncultured Chitinophaga sp.]|jgi:SusD family.|uniref:RagB/SusD family nutrient uptake outer membrane protein n=1 Tax=uncultured Chitinophaga sp. TaxID=339340 RepID=UPI0026327EFE|nr:RagB/SusD family nutrient uptake outer membrane protein [uncultured Chitinophaga sp.]